MPIRIFLDLFVFHIQQKEEEEKTEDMRSSRNSLLRKQRVKIGRSITIQDASLVTLGEEILSSSLDQTESPTDLNNDEW